MALDYLPSPGWAVVYGETPAADRWSELGENDDALATGVGLDDSAIKTRHLDNASVTSPKIDFTTFTLAYVERTTAATVAGNTPTQIAGLTATVTIPANVTSVIVSAYCPVLFCNTANVAAHFNLWQGAVGGTRLQDARGFQAGSSGTGSPTPARRVPVTPGQTYTFNVGLYSDSSGSTASAQGTPNEPMYLMVQVA